MGTLEAIESRSTGPFRPVRPVAGAEPALLVAEEPKGDVAPAPGASDALQTEGIAGTFQACAGSDAYTHTPLKVCALRTLRLRAAGSWVSVVRRRQGPAML